jgi:hypothetical protein
MKRQTAANGLVATSLIVPALIVLSICVDPHSAKASPKTCESLAQLAPPNTKVTAAQTVNAGEFMPPGRTAPLKELPAFCRVQATLTP